LGWSLVAASAAFIGCLDLAREEVSIRPDAARASPDGVAPEMDMGDAVDLPDATRLPDASPGLSDAAPTADAGPRPDADPPMPDAAPPMPDAAPPVQDAAPPILDAAPPVRDVAPPEPDPPVRDAAPPEPDPPVRDAAPPEPDAFDRCRSSPTAERCVDGCEFLADCLLTVECRRLFDMCQNQLDDCRTFIVTGCRGKCPAAGEVERFCRYPTCRDLIVGEAPIQCMDI
jgi:hypothetical protein